MVVLVGKEAQNRYALGELVGRRPCMGEVPAGAMDRLFRICSEAVEKTAGVPPVPAAASTDCNIPLSLGIPAVCVGLIRGGGAHTLNEWADASSMEDGLVIALRVLEGFFPGINDSWHVACGDTAPKDLPYSAEGFSPCLQKETLPLTETEKEELLDILRECDSDFCPPLSERGGTSEQSLFGEAVHSDGVMDYYHDILMQETLLWKREGKTIAFMSYRPSYTCRELENLGDTVYLTTLCIRRRCRGQGLSTPIYRAVIDHIKKAYPGKHIAYRTWTTNLAQMKTAEHFGFPVIAVLKDDRGPGVDTVYFQIL